MRDNTPMVRKYAGLILQSIKEGTTPKFTNKSFVVKAYILLKFERLIKRVVENNKYVGFQLSEYGKKYTDKHGYKLYEDN